MSTARVFASAVVPLGLFLAGFLGYRARFEVAHPREARTWPVEPREQLALAGIQGAYRSLADSLAPVVSDAQMRDQIVRFLAPRFEAVASARRDLEESVRRRTGVGLDVALIESGGVAWVETSR